MSDPFMGEIRLMSFVYPPREWALCNGQLLPINQNQALYALLGTRYGGNGQTNFALPDLRGRTPIHMSDFHTQGERGGEEVHTLSVNELPTHVHPVQAVAAPATTSVPTNGVVLAQSTASQLYAPPDAAMDDMDPAIVSSVGGAQAHENRQPYLTLSFCIALLGVFPAVS